MNPTIKNILAVIAGLLIGSFVNMGLILAGTSIIKFPEGIDPANVESIKAGIHLFEPKHFLTPFLAHAFGTLIGAFIAAKYGATKKLRLAMIVGGLFLLGGISNSFSIPFPMWFTVLDLVIAYIPMAYLGGMLAERLKK